MTGTGQAFKIRFGVFELDLTSGELHKGRTRVKLQDQPLRVLIALLNKPGEIVTREELKQELWPSDTFVDFEHGLRVAVNKLRQALNDDPENPRFLETFPRRGYRFICPVSSPSPAVAPVAEREGRYSSPVKSSPAASFFLQSRLIQILLALTILAISAAA